MLSRLILRSADNDAGPRTMTASQSAQMNFLLTDHVDWHQFPWVRTYNRRLLRSLASDTAEVHKHAKGCLMARQTLDPDAPFFAIARHGDDEQLQVHHRLRRGGGTEFRAAHFPYDGEGLHGEDAIFVRISLVPTPDGGVTAIGYGSMDLQRWHPIGDRVQFPSWLGIQGIAACSNEPDCLTKDGQSPKFFFGNVTKNEVHYNAASFPEVRPIGHVIAHQLFEHTWPLTEKFTGVTFTRHDGQSISLPPP